MSGSMQRGAGGRPPTKESSDHVFNFSESEVTLNEVLQTWEALDRRLDAFEAALADAERRVEELERTKNAKQG